MFKLVRILCIGDSYTAGYPYYDPNYGGNPENSYQYWLKYHLTNFYPSKKFLIENKGICGEFSGNALNRFKSLLKSNKYNIVIFWTGANDIVMGYNAQNVWRNLEKIGMISNEYYNFKLVLITIPPILDSISINDSIRDLNEKIIKNSNNNYIYIDAYNLLESNGILKQEFDAGDGVHLSIEGYKVIGWAIFSKINSLIENS